MTANRRTRNAKDHGMPLLGTSAIPSPSEIVEGNSDCALERDYYLSSHLEGIACLPECLWQEYAMRIPMHCPEFGFSNDEVKSGLEEFRGIMHATRYRYGRAVQPIKMLDDIAPPVGAIAFEFRTRTFPKELSQKLSFEYSRGYVSNLVVASIAAGDPTAIKKIERLASKPICNHINFFVWEAFWGCMDERTTDVVTLKSGFQIVIRTIPQKKDIKKFVATHRNEPMYSALSKLDDPGWAEVFRESGVRHIVQSAKRGPNAHR